MNDDYFTKIASQWIPAFRDGGNDIERLLVMFAKEVSRDTRHRAYDIAQSASRDIMNMRESN
jgi:hypothetical protein